MPKAIEPTPATPAPSVKAIEDPETVYDKVLLDTVLMFNKLADKLLALLFSPAFTAVEVRADLVAALAGDQARGKARGTYHMTVAERKAVRAETTLVFTHLSPTIEGGMPIGSKFRGDYFPLDNPNPTEGDLLITFSEGTAKHGWPTLPNGWTPAYLKDLGQRSNTAQQETEASAAGRSGQRKASVGVHRKVAKIRTRIRLLLVGWYGAGNADLLQFGIQPRKVVAVRRQRAKKRAVKPQPAPASDSTSLE